MTPDLDAIEKRAETERADLDCIYGDSARLGRLRDILITDIPALVSALRAANDALDILRVPAGSIAHRIETLGETMANSEDVIRAANEREAEITRILDALGVPATQTHMSGTVPLSLESRVVALADTLRGDSAALTIERDNARASFDGMAARCEELRAELDNERGEGQPPSEGWAWCDRRRCWRKLADKFGTQGEVTHANPGPAPGWMWWTPADPLQAFHAPTAREAMRRCDLATAPR